MTVGLLLALVVAHPQGFHKRVTVELWSTSMTGLVVMDVDGGDREQGPMRIAMACSMGPRRRR